MENNEKIHNPGCEKLLLVPKINSTTPGQKLKSHEKLIEDLRHFCSNQQAKLELLSHKVTHYKRLLESKEVTLTEEGKRQKGLIDRL